MIRNTVLKHKGGYYNYKVHEIKLNKLSNGFSDLKFYLNDVFKNCPDEYFNYGPRSSGLKFKLNNLKMHQVRGHEINDLTKQALIFNKNNFKENHPKVQTFMLENDDKTIAMEVPIWIYPEELKKITSRLTAKSPLTGHIDILRIEDNKIWIWDYKPNSFEEKYASTQVYFYSLMLSQRTKIPLDKFRCGYFDADYAYVFKPELELIQNKLLFEFSQ